MTNTAADVLVGKPAVTGGALIADVGTTLPTDATTALNAAFFGVGYVSEDGLTQSINADTQEIKAWGGDIVRRVQTTHDVTYHLTMIETTDLTLAAYYGDDNVSAGTVELVAGDLPYKSWVFEIDDVANGAKVRVVVPNGQITARGDVVFKDDTALGYDVTITAYPDNTGVKAYIYTDGTDAS